MANELKNRLQFVHCNTIFETREEAIAYVAGDLEAIQRPALYAEPMVLRYGDKDKPNIILAIGSKGDGVTASNKNKTFFIDFAQVQEEIEEVKELNNAQTTNIEALQDLITTMLGSCGLDKNGVYIPFANDPILSKVKALRDADLFLSLAIQEENKRAQEAESALKKELTLTVEDTNSLKLTKVSDVEQGVTLKGDVKLLDYKTIGERNLPNHILLEENGLYHYVDLTYDESNAVLNFNVNGNVKQLNMPQETHIVSGEYDTNSESLILKLNREFEGSDVIIINLEKLIGEWTVMGEDTDTPIILTKEPVKSEDVLHGADTYQDVLKADVRIAPSEYKPYNILEKTEDNKYLFVDGTAENIKYLKNGQIITVKEALDSVDDNVSNHDGNIIYRKEDGIFANVELEYLTGRNTLKFSKTNKNGTTDVTELTLNNITFLENIYYDSLTEELVVQYKDATGEIQELRVPVSSLFEEWVVDNTNHTVTLTKTEHQTVGKDKLSADVNIASTSDNILRVINHGLHVKGTSDNIKHGNGTVKDAIDLLNGTDDTEGSIRNLIKKEADERKQSDTTLQGLIESEKTRAEEAEKVLDGKILVNTNAINEESVRAKAAEEANKNSIDGEKLRATSEESRIEDKFDTAINKQGTVNTQITEAIKTLDNKIVSEISRSTNKDTELENSINVETQRAIAAETANQTAISALDKKTTMIANNTGTINLTKTVLEDGNGYTLSGSVNVSQELGNIINSDGSALKATVDLVYDGSKNTLTLKTSNNTDKVIPLNQGSIITSIRYESSTKELVITYQTADGQSQEVRVNVADLFNEVSVENPAENAVTLKMTDKSDGSQVITADVNVSSEPNNLLQKVTGNLYVSNAASGIKFEDGKSVVDKFNSISQTVSENKLDSDTKYNDLNGKVSTNISNITSLQEKDVKIEADILTINQKISQEINDRTAADTALNVKINGLESDLSDETQRAIEKENSLSDAIGVNTKNITNLTNTVEQNKKDLTCSVKNTENIVLTKEANASGDGYVLSGNVVVSSSEGNIIGKEGALFASVDLQYNSATNVLTLLTSNNASKEIKLSIGSIIKTITYDSENKQLVITYIDENQEERIVYVPVSDLYNEWIVEDRDESVIKLTKVKGLDGQPDVLKADLKLATPESGNLLQNTNGNLYASNKALDIKLSDHVGTNVEAAIINLNERVTQTESEVDNNTTLVNQLEQTVNGHTTLIQNNKNDIDNLKIDNNQNKQDIVDIKGDITEINGRLDSHDSSINNINTTIDSIEKNIENLQSKTNINTEDTKTIDMTYTYTTNSSNIKAEVKISQEADNLITVKEDGLHVLEDYDFGTY